MTPDALPEGLVERCIDASYYPEHPEWKCDDPIIRAEWRKLVVSVLAVAAPALREQALRETVEKMRNDVDSSPARFSTAMAVANNTPSTMKRFMQGIIQGEGVEQWLKQFESIHDAPH